MLTPRSPRRHDSPPTRPEPSTAATPADDGRLGGGRQWGPPDFTILARPSGRQHRKHARMGALPTHHTPTPGEEVPVRSRGRRTPLGALMAALALVGGLLTAAATPAAGRSHPSPPPQHMGDSNKR